MRKAIGIGETVLDIVFRNNQPQAAVPGGSTFNSMISLGRCGVPADFHIVPLSAYESDDSYEAMAFDTLSRAAEYFFVNRESSNTVKQRSGDLVKSNYKGLDGTKYIEHHASERVTDYYEGNLNSYLDCINWFNSEVKGSPVICEAYGDSYTDNCIVSAYTGLPTVFGWQTHEWLWRFHGVVDQQQDILVSDPAKDVWKLYITPRHNDVDNIYYSESPEDVQALIDKYHIEYIVMGDMERFSYGYDNSEVFAQLGEPVFESGGVVVYKVTPSSVKG